MGADGGGGLSDAVRARDVMAVVRFLRALPPYSSYSEERLGNEAKNLISLLEPSLDAVDEEQVKDGMHMMLSGLVYGVRCIPNLTEEQLDAVRPWFMRFLVGSGDSESDFDAAWEGLIGRYLRRAQ